MLILWKPSLNKVKWDSHHTSSLLFLYCTCLSLQKWNNKISLNYIWKSESKAKLTILSLFPCLSGRCKRPILNENIRHRSVSSPQNMRRSWKLIKLLGKREKTFPSMSDFTDTYHPSTSETGNLCRRSDRVRMDLIALGV